jgi:hypothetical protein
VLRAQVFVAPQPPQSPPGSLQVWNTPSNLTASFSALCWNFGVSLINKTEPDVPLGLVSSNVGGDSPNVPACLPIEPPNVH